MRGYVGYPPADYTVGVFDIQRHRELIAPTSEVPPSEGAKMPSYSGSEIKGVWWI